MGTSRARRAYSQTSRATRDSLLFERLVSDVSARFINAPADQVDSVVEDAIKLICESLGLDRGSVTEFSADKSQLAVTHSWAVEGCQPVAYGIATRFAWGMDRLLRGEMIVFSSIDDLLDEAAEVKQSYALLGTKSHASIPLSVGGSVLGALSLAALRAERTWPDELLERTQELELANRALRDSEERLRKIVESTPIPLTISRRSDSAILYANQLFYEALSITPQTETGRELLEFCCSPADRRAALIALRKDGCVRDQEVLVKARDGSAFWAATSIQPLVFEGQEALLAGFYDITARKDYEEKLMRLYEEEKSLRRQIEDEMNRRVEFTRVLAHELKTPLTPVLASSDSLVAELQDERLLSFARNISRGAQNLNRRIDELLDLARGEVGILEISPEPVDFLQVLGDAVESMTPLARRKGLSLSMRLPPSLPAIRADAARMQQVMLNLLDNAIKFTPKDGEIKLTAVAEDGSVVVEVRDTGSGIPAEEGERVFEPYQRLSGDTGRLGGLGLGLALCKKLVELHGGRIWVKSRPSGGSTFGFSLPIDMMDSTEGSLQETKRLWTVLVIEDDPEIVDAISLAFQKDWPEAALVSSTTGEDGIDMVETENPDIAILDLGLPDISGFEVLRQVRLFSSVPILVLTVRETEDDVAKALEWGADDYLTKPFRNRELLARLKSQLRRQPSVDDETPLVCGTLRFDPTTAQLRQGERDVSLTLIEGRIIQHLMKHVGQVVTHSRLAEEVWGEDYDGAAVSLRTHVWRLRKKLERDPHHPKIILTKTGIGYSLAKPA